MFERRRYLGFLALLSFILLPIHAHAEFIRGDANGDGVVDFTDAIAIFHYLTGGAPMIFAVGSPLPFPPLTGCHDKADANDDGEVTLADARYISDFVLHGGPQPPAPYPAPGHDLTNDSIPCGECFVAGSTTSNEGYIRKLRPPNYTSLTTVVQDAALNGAVNMAMVGPQTLAIIRRTAAAGSIDYVDLTDGSISNAFTGPIDGTPPALGTGATSIDVDLFGRFLYSEHQDDPNEIVDQVMIQHPMSTQPITLFSPGVDPFEVIYNASDNSVLVTDGDVFAGNGKIRRINADMSVDFLCQTYGGQESASLTRHGEVLFSKLAFFGDGSFRRCQLTDNGADSETIANEKSVIASSGVIGELNVVEEMPSAAKDHDYFLGIGDSSVGAILRYDRITKAYGGRLINQTPSLAGMQDMLCVPDE